MSIPQDLLPEHLARRDIPVTRVSVREASSSDTITPLKAMLHVGISTQVSSDGRLKRLALATCDAVTLISVESKEQSWMKMRDTALAGVLRSGPVLVGFGIARIALQIHHDIRVHINNGVDLSTLCSLSTREPWSPSKLVGTRLCPMASFSKIDRLWYGGAESEHSEREVVLRAWISAMLGEACAMQIVESLRVSTANLTTKELSILENLVVQSDALAAHEPKETPNDFIRGVMTTEGMKLENARYQNRVRKSHQTSVIMTNEHGQEFTGRADGSNGRVTDIKFDHAVLTGDLAAVRVVGKQELTNSEKARDEFLLLALRGELKITDGPFIRLLWLSGPEQRGELSAPTTRGTIATRVAGLNASQMRALDRMTSSMPIVIVQGPPGTGKTKTISAAAAVWEELGSPVWIVAQSNVAVKNIAQKLADLEITFKIVVSKEFYVEWHEHIYGPIEDFLIRTDELMADQRGIVHILSGARIVLSTLSTLSNPGLDQVGIFSLVPLERLVVDEASQINAFDFMHVFFKFRKSLQKVCFFGDPQQLPPYGQDQAPTLKSIFEFQHLQNLTEFLDTQYRMPIPIGQFISHCVYEGKLSSQHDIESMDCLAFIDARGAETSSGLSWKNPKEMQTICHLVRRYTQTGKKFCIITPYDAQRAAIERQLKDENLPHEAVYNVDSFQGNEEDYVLVSVVRTEAPGFLRSLNRMNVMLTRAKKGMVIVTCSSFLRGSGEGARTLLGKLAQYWETRGHETWIDWTRVADGTANLPGCSATHLQSELGLRVVKPMSSSQFPRISGRSVSIVAPHTEEKWRRPEIKDSDFPPLASTSTPVGPAKNVVWGQKTHLVFDSGSSSQTVDPAQAWPIRQASTGSWRKTSSNTRPVSSDFPPLQRSLKKRS